MVLRSVYIHTYPVCVFLLAQLSFCGGTDILSVLCADRTLSSQPITMISVQRFSSGTL